MPAMMERDAVLLVIRELESLAGGSERFQFTPRNRRITNRLPAPPSRLCLDKDAVN